MAGFFVDFLLVGGLIIIFVALLGTITNGFGNAVFGRFHGYEYVDQSEKTSKNFKLVGGKK